MADSIARAREVIAGWEKIGVPGGRPEDNLRMIREEVAKLDRMAAVNPRIASEAKALARRFGDMANKIRLGLN